MSISHTPRRLKLKVGAMLVPAALALVPLATLGAQGAEAHPSAVSAAGRHRPPTRADGNVLASDLIGTTLVDASGRNIGEVRDLLVRINDTGQVRLLASFDKLSGHDGRIYALGATNVRPAGEDKLLLVPPPGGIAQLKSWPSQSRLDWTDLGWWTGTANQDHRPGLATGFYTFHGTDLLGLKVEARDGTDLGKLDDLVVDLHHGQARYAVISFDPGVLHEEKDVVVPTQRFTRARAYQPGEPDRLVLDVGKADLRAMSGFDPDEWPDFNDPAYLASIDRLFQRTGGQAKLSQTGSASAGSSGWTPGWSNGPARGSGWTGDVTPLHFDSLDANHDGFISRQEGKANGVLAAQWDAVDANNDGRLSRDEFSHDAHLPNRAAR